MKQGKIWLHNIDDLGLLPSARGGYSIVDAKTGYRCLFENEEFAQALVEQLLSSGAPILETMPDPVIVPMPVGFFVDVPTHGASKGDRLAACVQGAVLPDEAKLVEYLASGHVVVAIDDDAVDVIAGDGNRIASQSVLSDGEYCWPDDLKYYLETYHVRLPDDFLADTRKRNYIVPPLKQPPSRFVIFRHDMRLAPPQRRENWLRRFLSAWRMWARGRNG